jgi:spermidine/putrescine transport system permease protein
MAVFVVVPLILIVFFAVTSQDGRLTFGNFSNMGIYTKVFVRSILLAVIATVVCFLFGYPFAYILSMENAFFKSIGMLLIMLPMWMNFLLRTYAWMSILENNGLLNRLLTWAGLPALHIINTDAAVVLGMVYNYLPFMILPIYSVIEKIDSSVIEAAQDLGGHPITVFSKVVFP